MVQTTFNFYGPKLPPNPYKPGTQSHKLYEWLRDRKKITRREIHREIHHVLFQDTARIMTDIMPYLRAYGYDIECKSLGDGDTLYTVVGG